MNEQSGLVGSAMSNRAVSSRPVSGSALDDITWTSSDAENPLGHTAVLRSSLLEPWTLEDCNPNDEVEIYGPEGRCNTVACVPLPQHFVKLLTDSSLGFWNGEAGEHLSYPLPGDYVLKAHATKGYWMKSILVTKGEGDQHIQLQVLKTDINDLTTWIVFISVGSDVRAFGLKKGFPDKPALIDRMSYDRLVNTLCPEQ